MALIHITLDSIACGTFSENTLKGDSKLLVPGSLGCRPQEFRADAGKEWNGLVDNKRCSWQPQKSASVPAFFFINTRTSAMTKFKEQ